MSITIKSPISGKELYIINKATEEDINNYFNQARKDQIKINKLSVKQRLNNIESVKSYILKYSEELIDKIVAETGKSRTDALVSEIYGILEYIAFLEKTAVKTLKDKKIKTPISLMGKKSKIYHDPLGVVLIISPWNYPLFQAIIPILGAYITGNAVIYKPSEHTPLKGEIEKIVRKLSGIYVVYGDGVTGSYLIDQKPNKIFFTGSSKTGRKIMKQASQYLIPVELELGGKDPMIVFEDVNLKRTVAGAVWGALTNCGQSCTSIERIYVQKSIYQKFVDLMIEEIKLLVISDNFDADIGCMTTGFQKNIVEEHIKDAQEKGAKLYSFGKSKNMFVPPTILTDLNSSMRISVEETFGPIIPVISFDNEEEVIELANDSIFGLSASVWSKNLKRAERVAHLLEYGNVSINNVMITEGNPFLPFGGVKESGFGRSKGVEGLYGFVNIKSVVIDKQSKKIEANWYPYTEKKYNKFNKLIRAIFDSGPMGIIKIAIYGMSLENEAQKKRN